MAEMVPSWSSAILAKGATFTTTPGSMVRVAESIDKSLSTTYGLFANVQVVFVSITPDTVVSAKALGAKARKAKTKISTLNFNIFFTKIIIILILATFLSLRHFFKLIFCLKKRNLTSFLNISQNL